MDTNLADSETVMNDASRFKHAGPAIENAAVEPNAVLLHWSDGTASRYLNFWLRETCPGDGDSLTGQRTLSLLEVPDDIAPTSVTTDGMVLHLQWPDGHKTAHTSRFLFENQGGESANPPALDLWDNQLDPDALLFDFGASLTEDQTLYDLMASVVKYGLARVRNMPFDGMTRLAEKIGYLHNTNYGLIMDVASEIKPWFRVMSSDAIPPHTDNCYRYTPTGITFFHCVDQIVGPGGESFYVDGLKMAERLCKEDPDAFRILTELPFTFHRVIPENASMGVDASHFKVTAPVFRRDEFGNVVGVRYHPRTVAPLPANDENVMRVYRARKVFEALSRDPSMRVSYQAAIGECTIYDNQRVLHARESFDGASEGTRRFRQCHIDREALHSSLRLLGRSLNKQGIDEKLLPGAAY